MTGFVNCSRSSAVGTTSSSRASKNINAAQETRVRAVRVGTSGCQQPTFVVSASQSTHFVAWLQAEFTKDSIPPRVIHHDPRHLIKSRAQQVRPKAQYETRNSGGSAGSAVCSCFRISRFGSRPTIPNRPFQVMICCQLSHFASLAAAALLCCRVCRDCSSSRTRGIGCCEREHVYNTT